LIFVNRPGPSSLSDGLEALSIGDADAISVPSDEAATLERA
jgi:hypothetical protein